MLQTSSSITHTAAFCNEFFSFLLDRGNGDGKTACILTGDHQSRVTDYTAIVMATGQAGAEIMRDGCPTLNCNHEQPIVATAGCLTQWDIQSRRIVGADGTSQTLYSKGKSGGAEGQTVDLLRN